MIPGDPSSSSNITSSFQGELVSDCSSICKVLLAAHGDDREDNGGGGDDERVAKFSTTSNLSELL